MKKLSAEEKCHWDDLNKPHYASFKAGNKVRDPVRGSLEWLTTNQDEVDNLQEDKSSDTYESDADSDFDPDHTVPLRGKDFINWRDTEQSSTLLVTGSPGQGKSVLTNFVVDNLKGRTAQQKGSKEKTIYFFCNIKNEESSRVASSILRSFIVQLCEDQRLYQRLPNRFKDKNEKNEFFRSSIDDLWVVFCDLITSNIYPRIYCIIDGLDVYVTDMVSLVKYLSNHLYNIKSGESVLKLFCTSRPVKLAMESGLSPCRTLRASKNDLSLFIDSELSSFEDTFTNDMRNEVTKTARAGMSRIFLWVSILLREIRELEILSLNNIKRKIEQLPAEMNDLYF
ncbi:hypothetical protein BOTCAL_0144g00190 [Botryotinia calthae]|uniref:Nephrocystin 3-like N-terminal domain-containing protein n=1 Tax=Botryotinia calthae TaxID=38488 RepID=A0A4Y8D576_9HELO|nr:hypothetical protein BOTCAL_0144g00190 [Botryotinia calthae]